MAFGAPAYGRADSDEFHGVDEHGVDGTLLEADLDDAIGVELGRFTLHHLHGLLAGRIEGCGLIGQLHVVTGQAERLGGRTGGEADHRAPMTIPTGR